MFGIPFKNREKKLFKTDNKKRWTQIYVAKKNKNKSNTHDVLFVLKMFKKQSIPPPHTRTHRVLPNMSLCIKSRIFFDKPNLKHNTLYKRILSASLHYVSANFSEKYLKSNVCIRTIQILSREKPNFYVIILCEYHVMQSCRQMINVILASRTTGLGLTERRLEVEHGTCGKFSKRFSNSFLTYRDDSDQLAKNMIFQQYVFSNFLTEQRTVRCYEISTALHNYI